MYSSSMTRLFVPDPGNNLNTKYFILFYFSFKIKDHRLNSSCKTVIEELNKTVA